MTHMPTTDRTLKVADVLSDLVERASAENDAVAYAALVEVQKYLPTAAASQPVPDASTQSPFRPGDQDVLEADPRGVNRRLP